MCDSHLGGIIMEKHCIKILRSDTTLVYSKSYPAGLKACKFENSENRQNACQNIFESARTEWAALIGFVSKIDSTLLFVGYRKLNAVIKPDFYPILRIGERINTFAMRLFFKDRRL